MKQPYILKKIEFDSRIFGFSTAKIEKVYYSKKSKNLNVIISNIIRDLLKQEIRYATYRVDSSEILVINELEKNGFVVVDGLISFVRPLSGDDFLVSDKIRNASEEDIIYLTKMSKGLFSTRIQNDPLISKRVADQFFAEWIANSVKKKVASEVLVWIEGKKPVGFATIKKTGQIPLVGVEKTFQGRGIAKKLVEACLERLSRWGVKEAFIDTQLDNIGALRAYSGVGFKVKKSYITLRWSNLPEKV